MHHGLVALYSVQLEQLGFVTLYPALAMAGAGQVGAGIALLIKARRAGNDRLASTIRGAVPAGILGVGEPMIYGVTLPLGRPFLTAGLGAGFGGAYAMLRQVASTTWGPSGVIGAFVMTAGPNGAVAGIIHYMIGLLISCAAGGLITYLVIGQDELRPETPAAAPVKTEPPASSGVVRKAVSHGDIILSAGSMSSNSCVIRDKNGIHARPAAALVKLAEEYDCKVSVSSGGKSAPLDSVIGIMSLGCTTVSVSCVRGSRCGSISHICIEAVTGAEVITGSTRLRAGTATKMILNMISTGAMVRMGKVYGNLMVDLTARNEKLYLRCIRILREAAGIVEDEAVSTLKAAKGDLKAAIIMAKEGCSREEALSRLKENGGRIRDRE